MKHSSIKIIIAILLSSCLVASCSRITQTGKASYYADKFDGRPTASGQRFSNHKRTAAHRTLPFGTRVKVTNLKTGRSVKVRINDRGPFVAGRMIDLSYEAARQLGITNQGMDEVEIYVVDSVVGNKS